MSSPDQQPSYEDDSDADAVINTAINALQTSSPEHKAFYSALNTTMNQMSQQGALDMDDVTSFHQLLDRMVGTLIPIMRNVPSLAGVANQINGLTQTDKEKDVAKDQEITRLRDLLMGPAPPLDTLPAELGILRQKCVEAKNLNPLLNQYAKSTPVETIHNCLTHLTSLVSECVALRLLGVRCYLGPIAAEHKEMRDTWLAGVSESSINMRYAATRHLLMAIWPSTYMCHEGDLTISTNDRSGLFAYLLVSRGILAKKTFEPELDQVD